MSIGTRIMEARKSLNMTQEELGKKLGISKSAVANYESGFNTPKTEIMYRLFDVLNVDANYLYQDEMKTIPYSLTMDELRLINLYRTMNEEGKKLAQQTVASFSATYQAGDNSVPVLEDKA